VHAWLGRACTQRLPRLQRPSSQRAGGCARHAAVQVAVPQVVDGAAGAPQQHRARAEERQQRRVRQRTRLRGQGDGAEAGPCE